MAKKLKGVTYKRQQKWYDIHCASLSSSEYIPLWKVEDISSYGIKVKIRHFNKSSRVIHLLSINELFMYLLIAWNSEIYEAYEQYGIPLEDSIRIANELNIAHPVYSDTKTPIVQTIDFMCKRQGKKDIAYLVKQASVIYDERTEDKLKIQKIFCEENNKDCEVVTSNELKTTQCENLENLYRHSSLNRMLIGVFRVWFSNFVGLLAEDRYERVASVLERSSTITGVPYSRAAQFLYHAIWVRLLTFDMSKPLVLESAASELELYPNAAYFPKYA